MIVSLSVKTALALSRPQQDPVSNTTMEVIQETTGMLPSRGALTSDARTRRRVKRMANQGDMIHPEEKCRHKVETNDAMLAAIDRLSVRVALTLTSALLDREVADDEASSIYGS